MSASVDIEGLRELRLELETAPERVHDELARVLARAALNVKKDWARRWSGHPSIRHLPRAINYDLDEATLTAEIGVDKDRVQGPLGNIIEFGTVNNAPIPGGAPSLAAEEPALVRHIADAIERSLIR